MPNVKQHCAISYKRTGFDFKELHEWIDAPAKELGYNHRIKRHAYNVSEEKQILEFWEKKRGRGWGKKAVVEWLFHIALDNLSTAFKRSHAIYGKNTFNYLAFGMSRNNYIHSDFFTYSEKELDEYFHELEEPEPAGIVASIIGFFRRRQ